MIFPNNQPFGYDERFLATAMRQQLNEYESINAQILNLPLLSQSRTLVLPYSRSF